MFLTFRQGTAKSSNDFLVVSGLTVTLNPISNVAFSAAHIDGVNYYIEQRTTVPNAWTLANTSTHYLYVDINTTTGAKTFGSTTVTPVSSNVQPISPVEGLLWFDLNEQVMKLYSNGKFNVVIRVIIASVTNSVVSYGQIGSNVGVSSPSAVYKTGTILTDSTGAAFLTDSGTFITTESRIHTVNAFSETLTLEAHQLVLNASFDVVRGDVVSIQPGLSMSPAVYGQTTEAMMAVVISDGLIDQPVNLIVQGVVTIPTWDWTAAPGSPLWIDNGTLVMEDPYIADPSITKQPPVARVIDNTSIWFDTSLGIVPHSHNADQILLSPTIRGATNVQDALSAMNNQFVDVDGAVMTGPLILVGSPVQPLEAATKQYVDGMTLEGLSNVLFTDLQYGDHLVFNGSVWTNGTIVADPNGDYVVVDIDTDVIASGINYDVTIPMLKLNLRSDELIDDIISDQYVGVVNINLNAITENRVYKFTIVAEHYGTLGNLYAEYEFDKPIKWINGQPPTEIPDPYYTLAIHFTVVPQPDNEVEYIYLANWQWYAGESTLVQTPISPFIPKPPQVFTQRFDPEILQLPDNSMVIICTEYDNNQPNSFIGQVVSLRSFDSGHTWDNTGIIFNNPSSEVIIEVCSTVTSTGEIYTIVLMLALPEAVCRFKIFNSSDSGDTWSESIDVLTEYSFGYGSDAHITASGQTLYVIINTNHVVPADYMSISTVVYRIANGEVTDVTAYDGSQNNIDVENSVDNYYLLSRADCDSSGILHFTLPEMLIENVRHNQLRIAKMTYNPAGSPVAAWQIEHVTPIDTPITEYRAKIVPSSADICIDGDDNIHVVFCVYRADLSPVYEWNQIMHTVSVDGGVTWSPATPISTIINSDINTIITDLGANVNVDDQGMIHVTWYRRTSNVDNDPLKPKQYFLYNNSADGGLTWGTNAINSVTSTFVNESAYTTLESLLPGSSNNSALDLTVQQNVLCSFQQYNNNTDVYDLYFAKIVNAARTPDTNPTLPIESLTPQLYTGAPAPYNEVPACILRKANGDLLSFVISWDDWTPQDEILSTSLKSYKSIDNGQTWTYYGTVRDTIDCIHGRVVGVVDQSDNIHLITSYRDPLTLTDFVVHNSSPTGQYWTVPHIVIEDLLSAVSVAISPNQTLHLIGSRLTTGEVEYYTSVDNGVTWVQGTTLGLAGSPQPLTNVTSSELIVIDDDNYYALVNDAVEGAYRFAHTNDEILIDWFDNAIPITSLIPFPNVVAYDGSSENIASLSIDSQGVQHMLAPLRATTIIVLPYTDVECYYSSMFYHNINLTRDVHQHLRSEPFLPVSEVGSSLEFSVADIRPVAAKLLIDRNDRVHAVSWVIYSQDYLLTGEENLTTLKVLYTNSDDGGVTWGQQLEMNFNPINAYFNYDGNFNGPQILFFIQGASFDACFDENQDIIVTYNESTENRTMKCYSLRFANKSLPPQPLLAPLTVCALDNSGNPDIVLVSNSQSQVPIQLANSCGRYKIAIEHEIISPDVQIVVTLSNVVGPYHVQIGSTDYIDLTGDQVITTTLVTTPVIEVVVCAGMAGVRSSMDFAYITTAVYP